MHIRRFSVLPTLVVEDGNGVPKGVTDAKDKYTYAEYLSLLPSNLGSGEDA